MQIRHVLPQPAMGILPLDPLNSAMTGVANTAWNLAVRQAAAGHEVEMVCPVRGWRSQHRSVAGVKVFWLPLWEWWRVRRVDMRYLGPLFLFTLRSRPVDVSHVHSSNPYLVIRTHSRATALHYQSPPINTSPQYDRAMSRVDASICCSQFVRHELANATTCPATRIHVVYNGADWARFAQKDHAAARMALDVPDDKIVVLYAGRVIPAKGLLVLVEAFKKIVQVCPDLLLLAAGSAGLGFASPEEVWRELQAYEQLVRQEALGWPVRFLGDVPQPRLPDFYRAGDIFVCPSVYQEPLGMVNLEAAAAGLPVVASAVGGIPEVVRHGQNGLLVPPGDAQALADALLRLISDRALRERLGRSAQDMARQFDWQVLTAQVMEVYDEALQQARR
jgi:glycosyltransferase involved in cell wall biosynthesis